MKTLNINYLPRKGLFYMKNIIILLFLCTSAHADMNDCAKSTDISEKNYCMATYSGSASFCDKVKGYERRAQCMRMVVIKQREIQYGTKLKQEKQGE
jgi:hypothetical protein